MKYKPKLLFSVFIGLSVIIPEVLYTCKYIYTHIYETANIANKILLYLQTSCALEMK